MNDKISCMTSSDNTIENSRSVSICIFHAFLGGGGRPPELVSSCRKTIYIIRITTGLHLHRLIDTSLTEIKTRIFYHITQRRKQITRSWPNGLRIDHFVHTMKQLPINHRMIAVWIYLSYLHIFLIFYLSQKTHTCSTCVTIATLILLMSSTC